MTDKKRYALIRQMKGMTSEGGAVTLPVRDAALREIGRLRAFTGDMLADDGLIALMAESRTRYEEFFLTRFDVTPENKRRWLGESVLKNDSKMLFLVETLDGRIVGQDGFTLFGGGCFALDGTMRWARGGHTRLFERSVIERLGLCFGALGCSLCEVEIFEKNQIAIGNVLNAGFSIEARYPLSVTEKDGVIAYSKTSAGRENTDERLVSLTMTKNTFVRLHGDFLNFICLTKGRCV
jgi:hypothetical protein